MAGRFKSWMREASAVEYYGSVILAALTFEALIFYCFW